MPKGTTGGSVAALEAFCHVKGTVFLYLSVFEWKTGLGGQIRTCSSVKVRKQAELDGIEDSGSLILEGGLRMLATSLEEMRSTK